ncbi:hypothetical protein GCM10023347_46270 [Streptomyces chumphonensis]|uniref:Uncharacterized protein n=1 Tax=Streptomyces chumphonensis TaxID=1214925 RepID=A0A927EY95_9ACTN|nr:hypothetical protein [Streptomyces chumphonensis]MBD3932229.1 hypothetical protein [Streptomyces chumphonensis]
MTSGRPEAGETLYDEVGEAVGEFHGERSAYLLRPLGGGKAWLADPADVRRPTRDELIRARLTLANRESRMPR